MICTNKLFSTGSKILVHVSWLHLNYHGKCHVISHHRHICLLHLESKYEDSMKKAHKLHLQWHWPALTSSFLTPLGYQHANFSRFIGLIRPLLAENEQIMLDTPSFGFKPRCIHVQGEHLTVTGWRFNKEILIQQKYPLWMWFIGMLAPTECCSWFISDHRQGAWDSIFLDSEGFLERKANDVKKFTSLMFQTWQKHTHLYSKLLFKKNNSYPGSPETPVPLNDLYDFWDFLEPWTYQEPSTKNCQSYFPCFTRSSLVGGFNIKYNIKDN